MSSHIDREMFDQVMVPNYAPLPVIPVRGEGSRVWDQQGKEYIDFAGGIAVNALGHCHPHLLATLQQQAEKLWHLSNVWTNEPALQLAALLCEETFAERVYFANSGAEANEAAFKLARKYAHDNFGADKYEIISCLNGFHGRTLFTVSVGGQAKYCEGFEPLPPGIRHIPFNDPDALAASISEKTAAVVIEPIQGEGGIVPASPEFMQTARELCNQHNALLILDEIQTGVGRTGKLYAYQHSTITPDILTTAKSLGGGFPIAAMLCTEQAAQSFGFGSHGSTYGGNPLGCAVATAVLELVKQPDLLAGVIHKSEHFLQLLNDANQTYPVFSEFRGQGLLLGAAMRPEYAGCAKELLQLALDAGVMTLIAGPNVLRMAPSLIIPDQEIKLGISRLKQAMAKFLEKRA